MKKPNCRVHIVGISPRTGTTLLAESMAVCFDIDHCEEHERGFSNLKRARGTYLTKRPSDLNLIEPRLRLDRRFWAICLMRDPRDVIVSRHGKNRDQYWAPLRIWKSRLQLYHRLYNHPRFLAIRYEELVSRPDRVQRRIEAAMPFLTRKADFSEFHQLAKPSDASIKALGDVRPINPSSIGNWRQNTARVAGQIALHGSISEELVELGYEKDDQWMGLLEGVEPDTREYAISRYAKPRTRLQKLKRKLWTAYPAGGVGFTCDRLNIPFL
ncbi:MAG: sulfotransferase family protein [Pseudomonadota bacterium]